MNDFKISDMLKTLYDAVAPVSLNRFVGNRPKTLTDKINDYIVVNLPASIRRRVIGSGYGASSTVCAIELYARDTAIGQSNILKLDEMTQATEALFPITANGITASSPRVVMQSPDDTGFHCVIIHAALTLS